MTAPDSAAQSGTGDVSQSGDAGTTGQAGDTQGTADGSTGQSAGQTQTAPAPVDRAEYERVLNQLRAADQNKAKAESELKQLRDKDLPALEKAQRDLTEANARAEKAEAELQQTRIETAFLRDNKYKWKNPATALKLADLSGVTVDDDGKVHNLLPALEALAKSDAYLIEDADGAAEAEKPNKGSTGAPNAGGRTSGADTKGLVSRLPALRTRGVS